MPLQEVLHLFGLPFSAPSSQVSIPSITRFPQTGVVVPVQVRLHFKGWLFCGPSSHCSVLSFVLSPQRGSWQSDRQASATKFALHMPPSRKQASCRTCVSHDCPFCTPH